MFLSPPKYGGLTGGLDDDSPKIRGYRGLTEIFSTLPVVDISKRDGYAG
jgi:hypothetical protein